MAAQADYRAQRKHIRTEYSRFELTCFIITRVTIVLSPLQLLVDVVVNHLGRPAGQSQRHLGKADWMNFIFFAQGLTRLLTYSFAPIMSMSKLRFFRRISVSIVGGTNSTTSAFVFFTEKRRLSVYEWTKALVAE